jgi:tetratricopeptide (TPR) repeat protein
MDVYARCPCGSEKKLKFCCLSILADMQKSGELRESRQFQRALQNAEAALKRPGLTTESTAWLEADRAISLLALGQNDEGKAAVARALELAPFNAMALVVRMHLAVEEDDLFAARTAVENLFEHVDSMYLASFCDVAIRYADFLSSRRHFAAALQYLLLAASCNPDEKEVIQPLSEFAKDRSIPAAWRVSIPLMESVARGDSLRSDYDAALKQFSTCRFAAAASAFEALARKQPKSGEAWFNVGLSRMLAAEPAASVAAFRHASNLLTDEEQSIDAEFYAQRLELDFLLPQRSEKRLLYSVESVSRALTDFDAEPRLLRDRSSRSKSSRFFPGVYLILSDPLPEQTTAALDPEALPREIGGVIVGIANPERGIPARVYVTIPAEISEADAENALKVLVAAGGSNLQLITDPAAQPKSPPETSPTELTPLHLGTAIPPWASHSQKLAIVKASRPILVDRWLNSPKAALQNKTPLEVADDPALRRALSAAVILFDYMMDSIGFVVDVGQVRSRIRLGDREPMVIPEDQTAGSLSLLQLERLSLSNLTDEQLTLVCSTAACVNRTNLLYAGLQERLSRPIGTAQGEPPLFLTYAVIANQCRLRGATEESLAWYGKARRSVIEARGSIEQQLLIDMEELTVRSGSPSDPQTVGLAHQIWSTYVQKLPDMEDIVGEAFRRFGIPGPWNDSPEGILIGEGRTHLQGETSSLWTPSSAAPAPAGAQKIWLPGLD